MIEEWRQNWVRLVRLVKLGVGVPDTCARGSAFPVNKWGRPRGHYGATATCENREKKRHSVDERTLTPAYNCSEFFGKSRYKMWEYKANRRGGG